MAEQVVTVLLVVAGIACLLAGYSKRQTDTGTALLVIGGVE